MKPLALLLALAACSTQPVCDLSPGLAFRTEIKTRAEIAWLAALANKPKNTFALALFPGTPQCIIWMPPSEGIEPSFYTEAFCHEARHCKEGHFHE